MFIMETEYTQWSLALFLFSKGEKLVYWVKKSEQYEIWICLQGSVQIPGRGLGTFGDLGPLLSEGSESSDWISSL